MPPEDEHNGNRKAAANEELSFLCTTAAIWDVDECHWQIVSGENNIL
jgi:hypothetical protein